MQGACSEAVFMMGIERNSDRVEMSCFAPFFEHLDMNQWQPNLIVNDNGPNTLTGSVSYYVQKMFSNHAGKEILPVETVADFGPLYWSASKSGKQYIVKLANYGEKRQAVNINLPVVATNASVDLLASDDIMQHGPLLYNSPGQVKIQTKTEALQSKDGRLSLSLAPWAVAVVYT
ncbi:hypothetical protein KEM55_000708 [Ascosphaera atra]|nr:hypothetical protein KEM55_000708 [Ascosphaera atra]